MIPAKLALRNFMCYRDKVPPLYFDGIHVVCLCGDNGSGKSALLDAITWALWGKSRAKSDDELIHLGQKEMEVEFDFIVGATKYKVLRKCVKSGRSSQTLLELQVASDDGFKSISGNSQRETQQRIIDILRMDYTTFVNSAFLRQGRADEFTIKSPGERKKVLADILDLSFYDELEEQAKTYARDREQEQRELENRIKEIEAEFEHKGKYEAELQEVERALAELDRELKDKDSQLSALRDDKKALEFKKEQLAELKREVEQRRGELSHWETQVEEHSRKLKEYEAVLGERREVEEGYAQLEEAKKEKEELDAKLRASVPLRERKANLEKTIEKARGELLTEQKLVQTKVEELKAKSRRMPEFEEKLSQAQEALNLLAQQEKELEGKRRQSQEIALEIQHLKSTNIQLKRDSEELREKLDLLARGDARCPLCETELGVEGRQRIEAKYKAELSFNSEAQNKNDEEIKHKERTCRELEQEIIRVEQGIERGETAEQRRVATLEKGIAEAREATAELASKKAELGHYQEKLSKRDFAVAEQSALRETEQQLMELGYDEQRHQATRQLLVELEKYEGLKRKLEEAENSLPLERTALTGAKEAVEHRRSLLEKDLQKAAALSTELDTLPQLMNQLNQAEQSYESLRQLYFQKREVLGAVQQKLDNCAQLEKVKKEKKQSLLKASREKEIYQKLTQAFGKKGIQAFLIESALPEIEIEANRLLGRMTDHRLHVKIETQQPYKTKRVEPMETLDIKISDELGTRSYELYSGGEAFRINFALRIALSKLLARRAGAPLPTLIIDEGFGTQDSSGLDRLVEAIKSIQDDFEKIFVITHLEELKEAFPVRIEVTKTSQGSMLSIS